MSTIIDDAYMALLALLSSGEVTLGQAIDLVSATLGLTEPQQREVLMMYLRNHS